MGPGTKRNIMNISAIVSRTESLFRSLPQSIISTLISGLQLVKSLSGQSTALPADTAYMNSANTTQLIVGLSNSAQGRPMRAATFGRSVSCFMS
jgi:hypothetical protein